MQRAILGYLSLLLLVGGILLLIAPGIEPGLRTFGGAMLRVSVVFGATWLAIPNFNLLFTRVPPWLFAATFIGGILLAYNFKATFLFVLPLLTILWVLVPSWWQRRKK